MDMDERHARDAKSTLPLPSLLNFGLAGADGLLGSVGRSLIVWGMFPVSSEAATKQMAVTSCMSFQYNKSPRVLSESREGGKHIVIIQMWSFPWKFRMVKVALQGLGNTMTTFQSLLIPAKIANILERFHAQKNHCCCEQFSRKEGVGNDVRSFSGSKFIRTSHTFFLDCVPSKQKRITFKSDNLFGPKQQFLVFGTVKATPWNWVIPRICEADLVWRSMFFELDCLQQNSSGPHLHMSQFYRTLVQTKMPAFQANKPQVCDSSRRQLWHPLWNCNFQSYLLVWSDPFCPPVVTHQI